MSKRIAFPSGNREIVEEHFGHCKDRSVYNIDDNGNTISVDYLIPPSHAPGVLPKFLGDNNVDVIITGGMGAMAVKMFKEQNIDVILGATGTIETNLKTYLEGDLSSTDSACNHEHGHHHGNGHHHH